MDFSFMGGSMGSAVGEKFSRACDSAIDQGSPLIAVSSSGGARMQEGIFSLMQLPKTVAAVADLHDAGLPLFVVLAHPTTGGTLASFATLGDVTVAEPSAVRRAQAVAAGATAAVAPEDLPTPPALPTDAHQDGFHVVFETSGVEAQAAGRPVLAADAGGATETVVEGETGHRVAVDDVDAFAEALSDADFGALEPATIIANARRFSAATFRSRMRAEVERVQTSR